MERALGRLGDSIDAVYLKELVLLRESVHVIRELKDFMRKNNLDKPIIIDYRLEQSEFNSLKEISGLLRNEGAYGITIMAIYGEDFVKSCRKQAEIGIFAIVDIGLRSFRERFDDSFVVDNAIFARDNKCEGVVTTSKHLDRLKKVRDAVGTTFPLLCTLEKASNKGDSISIGADFEIVPYTRFLK